MNSKQAVPTAECGWRPDEVCLPGSEWAGWRGREEEADLQDSIQFNVFFPRPYSFELKKEIANLEYLKVV